MFKKPFTTKSQTTVRSSDRRKLRQEILSTFPNATDQDLNQLLPTSISSSAGGPDNLTVSKITPHGIDQQQSLLYTYNNQPIFIKLGVDAILIPTIYTLWKCPNLLPKLITHPFVIKRLLDGADLMLPGVVVPNGGFKQGDFKKDQVVAVVMRGNPFPLVVGTAVVDSHDVTRSGMKGKGVHTLHSYGDQLWLSGDRSEPPDFKEVVAAVNDDDDDEDEEVEEGVEGENDEVVEGGGNAVTGGKGKTVDEEDYEVVDAIEDGASDLHGVESIDDIGEEITSLSLAPTSPTESGIVEVGIETEMNFPGFSKPQPVSSTTTSSVFLPPAEVDKALTDAFLTAIKLKLPEDAKQYPIPSSALYSNYILPCRTVAYATVDVKHSSFKKLAKFLKAMEKRGYVKLKERAGDTVLVSVNRKHPEILAFTPGKYLVGDGSSGGSGASAGAKGGMAAAAGLGVSGVNVSGSSSSSAAAGADKANAETVKIVELYRSNGSVVKLWEEIGIAKDTLFTRAELRSALENYVKAKDLVSPDDGRLVKLDMYLADVLLRKGENDVDYLARDAILSRLVDKMSPFHELTLPGQDPVVKKGTIKPMSLIIETRAGRKTVTRISGIEAFGIDPEELSSQLRTRCASSTSVTPLSQKSSMVLVEVMVQGSKVHEVCECLAERYGIPFGGGGAGAAGGVKKYGVKGGAQSKYVEIVDKT
ncbi:Eukaryotic translation initiation factor 2D [Blyttiomyces sp. JEL0837]|nr:Eukaryotic translation initiation factor 2D [Blyttiomyces sp. JEL0837]